MSPLLRPRAESRAAQLAGLTLAVLLAHVALTSWLTQQMDRLGAGDSESMRRIEVAFVRELQPSLPPPPVAPSRASAQPPGLAARPPRPAASAPLPQPEPVVEPAPAEPLPTAAADQPAPVPTAADQPVAQTLEPQASLQATAADSAPPVAVVAAAAASSAVASFEWPPSTRLSYTLVGDYRGPVHGTAQVEWLRRGDRYQVHLEVSVGPLVSRRMSSEGLLTEQGLQPLRYEETTQALFSEPRRRVVRFEPGRIILADGQARPTLAQVQDTASQFVQLTWLFTTQRDRLRAGQMVEVPLALPRRVDRWLYDVQAEEELETPAGRLKVFHIKPRRTEPLQGELVVESWFAPSLQYLPVRILIRQDTQTFIDLTLSRAPQQSAPEPVKPQ